MGIYGDWFPWGNGFRLTSGVQIRNQQVRASGRLTESVTIPLPGLPVPLAQKERITGRVKFPVVVPYLGIGWDSTNGSNKKGFGFVFDLGVSFGTPKTSLRIEHSPGYIPVGGKIVEKELARDRKKLHNLAGKLKILPQVYVGISYRF